MTVIQSPIAVIAIGACTPVGLDIAATQAAAMAGIQAVVATEALDHNGEAIRAFRFQHFEPAASRVQRAAWCARVATVDLLAAIDGWPKVNRLPVFIGLPREFTAPQAKMLATELQKAAPRHELVFSRGWAFPQGRASFFAALQSAVQYLNASGDACALVGAADSQCDPETLAGLCQARRILSEGVDGIIPGEGAGFVLIANATSPLASSECSYLLNGPSMAQEVNGFSGAEPNLGDGLAMAFRAYIDGSSSRECRVDRVLSCQTGELFWAREFNAAYFRSLRLMPEPLRVDWLAQYFGDLGAAAPPLALALAQHWLGRPEQSGVARVLIYACSDSGLIGSVIADLKGPLRSRLDQRISEHRGVSIDTLPTASPS